MSCSDSLLWVDDDPIFCRNGAARLRKLRFQVEQLHDPTYITSSIALSNPGVILLDIDLGVVDGLTVLRQIREMDGDRRVILVTGTVSMEIVLEAMRLGADYCFFKETLDFKQLSKAITALQFRRAHWHRAALFAAEACKPNREHVSLPTNTLTDPSQALVVTDVLRQMHERSELTALQFQALQEALIRSVPKIGQLALEGGLLDMRGFFQILQEQSLSSTPFGQIAIQLGLLTTNAVDQLLDAQRDRIAEVLEAEAETLELTASQFHSLLDNIAASFCGPLSC